MEHLLLIPEVLGWNLDKDPVVLTGFRGLLSSEVNAAT
jgi:hypothetical protein